MKDFVTTFEQTSRLYELGIRTRITCGSYSPDGNFSESHNQFIPSKYNLLRALDCRLLAEILPREIEHNLNAHSSFMLGIGYCLHTFHNVSGELTDTHEPCVYYTDNDLEDRDDTLCCIGAPTMAQAMGKALIWLLENNHVDINEVNDKIHSLETKYSLTN